MSQMTDAQLLHAVRDGKVGALDAFYRRFAKQVLSWCIRLGGPHVDAEDLAQDVFSVAFRKLDTFRGESALSTWLFAVTRNVVSNARRKAMIRRWVGLDSVPEVECPRDTPEEDVLKLRQRRQVQLALERLGDKAREVLVLMDMEGRTAPEVGEMLGIPPGTVYSRLHYARKAFAKALEHEGLGRADVLGHAVSAEEGS